MPWGRWTGEVAPFKMTSISFLRDLEKKWIGDARELWMSIRWYARALRIAKNERASSLTAVDVYHCRAPSATPLAVRLHVVMVGEATSAAGLDRSSYRKLVWSRCRIKPGLERRQLPIVNCRPPRPMSLFDQRAASSALATSQECVCPTLDLTTGGDLAQRMPLESLGQSMFVCRPMSIFKPCLGLVTLILGVRHRERQVNMHVYRYHADLGKRGRKTVEF